MIRWRWRWRRRRRRRWWWWWWWCEECWNSPAGIAQFHMFIHSAGFLTFVSVLPMVGHLTKMTIAITSYPCPRQDEYFAQFRADKEAQDTTVRGLKIYRKSNWILMEVVSDCFSGLVGNSFMLVFTTKRIGAADLFQEFFDCSGSFHWNCLHVWILRVCDM